MLKKNYSNIILKGFLWSAVLVIAIYIGYDNSIQNIGYTPKQQVIFSHKLHSGIFGIKCLFCHANAERSFTSTLPSTRICMSCHIALNTESDSLKIVNQSYDSIKPLKYNRIYQIPDYTHFNHSKHLQAGIDCSSCHGLVDTMEVVHQVRALTMKWCLDCHREPDKFIVKAREISGIFINDTSDSNTTVSIENYNDVVKPSFGMFNSEMKKQEVKGIPTTKLPARGPENCSSCHY